MSDQHTNPLRPIESRLASLRSRARSVLVAAGSAYVLAVALATILAAALIDFVVRTPDWFRLALLLAGIVGLITLIRRHLRPATQFNPTITDVALRVENSAKGHAAGLTGSLTSALELQRDLSAAPPTTRALAERAIADAHARVGSFSPLTLLDTHQLRRRLGLLTAASAALVITGLLAGPAMTRTAAARLLTPWAGAQWPKRTEIVDATAATVHPLGQALNLKAALTRTPRAQSQTRVTASYRLLGPGLDSTIRRLPLTGQGRSIIVEDAERETVAGELYERLVDLDLPRDAAAANAELEYWLTTDDDQTAPIRLRLVEPPAIVGVEATITPPLYAGAAPANFATGRRDLGIGGDARAVVGPILASSNVEMLVRFNKPLPGPTNTADLRAFLAAAAPGATEPWPPADFVAEFNGAAWSLRFSADQTRRLPLKPRDEFGLTPREEAAFSLDVVADRPPAAVVLEPRDDQAVLATARVALVGEGRDDVGLSALALQYTRAAPAAGSVGAATEPIGDQIELVKLEPGEAPPLTASLDSTLDLSTVTLKPGDEVWVTVLAADGFAGREPVRSSPRKLRIISEQQLLDQVRNELGNLRRAAIRLEADQTELTKPVDAGAVSPEDRRRQEGLGQRIEQQREAVKRIADRLEQNRLEDEAMRDMLAEAQQMLSGAQSAAERAARQMDRAAEANPDEPNASLNQEQKKMARAEQDAARDQLAKLAELLDKGEDSWVAARSVQRLLEQQKLAQSQTRSAGQETQGAKPEDLTPAQRQRLSELAQQQQRLAEQARQATEQLAQRAEQMKSVDPAQAQGMKQAEQRAREQQLSQAMQRAAKAIEENKTSEAEAQQQQAVDALQQMMQDMQQAKQNRQARLKRVVEELVQTLARLVARQEAELALLTKADGLAGLDKGMIDLNQQTLAAAETARGDRALSAIAAPIERAADEQGKAVVALRAADAAAAETAERESVKQLQLALDQAREAAKKNDDAERDQKRGELRAAYAAALELQAALKAETDAFTGKQLQRRERIAVRGLGERQEAIRESLKTLREKTKDIDESSVFQLAHDRLDAAGNVASKKLRDGTADASAARHQQSIVATLRALVQALDEAKREDDPFRDDEGGGGGGGGQGGQKPPLIPPLAELRLLRGIQADVAERTRGADEGKDEAEVRRLADEQSALAKRGQELVEKVKQQGGPKKEEGGEVQ